MVHEKEHHVGIIGLGQMGMPMCARLVERGFAVVATDLVAEREPDTLAVGARWAESAVQLAAQVGVVITVLPGAVEVTAIAEPLIAALTPGATWIDMSSAEPETARAVGTIAAARGVHTFEAPVGGNPAAARGGEMLAFVGAEPGDMEAQRDVLQSLADRVVLIGPPGSGYAVKLLVNLLWFGQAIAHSEALTLAARLGLDPEAVRAALQHTAAASNFGERDAPTLLRGNDMASFSLAQCSEQLTAVLALGEQLDVPLQLATTVAAIHQQALARYGDVDGELLAARLVAERAGINFGRLRA
jgi:3-hydroxyisobutyrate dehydrogenase